MTISEFVAAQGMSVDDEIVMTDSNSLVPAPIKAVADFCGTSVAYSSNGTVNLVFVTLGVNPEVPGT